VQFNSLTFAPFLLPVLLSYYFAPRPYRWLPLLIASYLFYAATDALHIGILIGLTLFSYWVARKLEEAKTAQLRRSLLWTGLVPILIALVGFRCLALFLPGSKLFSIPLGLSFFALRLASYLVDVFNNRANAERHVGTFSLYVAVFPELPAGPIDRAGALLPQLKSPSDFRYREFTSGVKLFAWGLFKKVVIADRLRLFVSAAYDSTGPVDGAAYCVATVLFAFQIYCDFSGYSDMAIGLGEMFGLKFAKNFDRPYLSRSVSEFWTRWHISFSSWLRDYVFLPLMYKAGRVLDGRMHRVVSVEKLGYAVAAITTMALAGLWHGAALHYVAWGVIVAVYMVVSVLTRKLRARLVRVLYGRKRRRVHDAVKVAMTFFLVNVSWVFFRANSLGDAVRILGSIPGGVVSYLSRILNGLAGGRLVGTDLAAPLLLGQGGFNALLAVVGLLLLLCVELLQQRGSVRQLIGAFPIWVRWPLYVTLVLAIIVFRAPAGTKFIYAGF
jgi:alginate O-acetyltransferase complex protein AlgI